MHYKRRWRAGQYDVRCRTLLGRVAWLPVRDTHGGKEVKVSSQFKHQIQMTDFIKTAWNAQKSGVLIAAETGVGKTRSVLDAIEPDQKVLVAAPAIARGEWMRQGSLWAPHLQMTAADTGKKVEQWCEAPQGILVTSYNLLKHVTNVEFDLVCLDETQMVSNPDAQMTQEAYRVVNTGENTMVAALSATPALDRPDQLWSILNLCEPGKWGENIWWFRRRYCNAVPNEWATSGVTYKGLRADRAEELRKRLESVMFRVRKSDIAESLPPLTISMRYVKAKRAPKGLDWNDEDSFSQLLALNSSGKLDAAVEIISDARASGESKFVVFTFLRETAHQCGARLHALGLEVEVVTGEIPSDARHAPIDRVRTATKPAVLVCNIDAIGVSLDFTFAQTSLFVEQHWVPGKTLQAIGRLQRLSSKHAAQCIFVVCENSKEQRQAETFCRKAADLNAIISPGRDEIGAIDALGGVQESDEDILAGLV